MARVVANPYGEFRGKLGGMVFSATAGRKTVRAYSVPIQPNTEAQLSARASFGAAAQSYHSLTDGVKIVWESYAKGIFNAKDQYNEGQWSGANAFTSLRNFINMSARSPLTMSYENDSDTALDGTVVPFEFQAAPPTDQLQANIKSGIEMQPCPVILEAAELHADGKFDITMGFGGCLAAGLGQDNLEDGVGNPFGFAVYVSNVINQASSFVTNPAMQLLGIMPSLSGKTLVGLTDSQNVHIINNSALDLSKFKSFGQEDDEIEIKVYQVSKGGMVACNGAKRIVILPTA
jgi:hypothetical protein